MSLPQSSSAYVGLVAAGILREYAELGSRSKPASHGRREEQRDRDQLRLTPMA